MKRQPLQHLLAAVCIIALPLIASPRPAQAKNLRSFCKYIPEDEKAYTVARPCVFSVRKGVVSIIWDNGVINRFVPHSEQPFTYTDQQGRLVYQQAGSASKTYQMEQGKLWVYWGGSR